MAAMGRLEEVGNWRQAMDAAARSALARGRNGRDGGCDAVGAEVQARRALLLNSVRNSTRIEAIERCRRWRSKSRSSSAERNSRRCSSLGDLHRFGTPPAGSLTAAHAAAFSSGSCSRRRRRAPGRSASSGMNSATAASLAAQALIFSWWIQRLHNASRSSTLPADRQGIQRSIRKASSREAAYFKVDAFVLRKRFEHWTVEVTADATDGEDGFFCKASQQYSVSVSNDLDYVHRDLVASSNGEGGLGRSTCPTNQIGELHARINTPNVGGRHSGTSVRRSPHAGTAREFAGDDMTAMAILDDLPVDRAAGSRRRWVPVVEQQ